MIVKNRFHLKIIARGLRYSMPLIIGYMVLISILDEVFKIKELGIPIAIPSIMGTAIALLLGFRTNSAYQRWWEARTIWGAIVNDSRSLLRQSQAFIGTMTPEINKNEEAFVQFHQKLAYRQAAWCKALSRSLRGQDPLEGLDAFISAEEIHSASIQKNVPNALLQQHSRQLREALEKGWLNHFQHLSMEDTVIKLCDSMGACERIKNTVFPTSYSHYIDMFIYLFIVILPFGLVEELGYVEIPLTVSIAYVFLSIDRVAMYLQDPFENKVMDTPMSALSRTIEINLKQMLGEKDIPAPLEPEKGWYLM